MITSAATNRTPAINGTGIHGELTLSPITQEFAFDEECSMVETDPLRTTGTSINHVNQLVAHYPRLGTPLRVRPCVGPTISGLPIVHWFAGPVLY